MKTFNRISLFLLAALLFAACSPNPPRYRLRSQAIILMPRRRVIAIWRVATSALLRPPWH